MSDKARLQELLSVAKDLSGGVSFPVLFKKIMKTIRHAANADGGSLYIHDGKLEKLKIVVLTNESLGVESVVEEFDPLRISGFIEVELRAADGRLNVRTPSAACFLRRQTIMIRDIGNDAEFDFSRVREFDKNNNYKTERMLLMPLFGNDDSIIGVLHLINPAPGSFEDKSMEYIEALAGYIGISLNNALLINETKNLLTALVQMVGVAIDEKSPHTAGHCQRVTELTLMLSDAVCEEKSGPFADFSMSPENRNELRLAALLHDIGKIITPMHILEKPTKLFTVDDRISLLQDRISAWKLSSELNALRRRVKEAGREDLLAGKEDFDSLAEQDIEFLRRVNRGEVFMNDDAISTLNKIAYRRLDDSRADSSLITDNDLQRLQVRRGTLTPEERKIMEEHVSISIRLLSSIPWPKELQNIVEYAGNHHERMNGTGYPNGIKGDDMSVQARMLGIADRFEGLSAPDRPYRSVSMKLSKVLGIMKAMENDEEIDAELFEVFMRRKIYMTYAQKHLPAELIDCD